MAGFESVNSFESLALRYNQIRDKEKALKKDVIFELEMIARREVENKIMADYPWFAIDIYGTQHTIKGLSFSHHNNNVYFLTLGDAVKAEHFHVDLLLIMIVKFRRTQTTE